MGFSFSFLNTKILNSFGVNQFWFEFSHNLLLDSVRFFSNLKFFCSARDYKTSEESVGTKCENISEFPHVVIVCFFFYLSPFWKFLYVQNSKTFWSKSRSN